MLQKESPTTTLLQLKDSFLKSSTISKPNYESFIEYRSRRIIPGSACQAKGGYNTERIGFNLDLISNLQNHKGDQGFTYKAADVPFDLDRKNLHDGPYRRDGVS